MKIESQNTLSKEQLQTSIATRKKRKRTPIKVRTVKDTPPTNKLPGRKKNNEKKSIRNALRNVNNRRRVLSIYHSSSDRAEIIRSLEDKEESLP